MRSSVLVLALGLAIPQAADTRAADQAAVFPTAEVSTDRTAPSDDGVATADWLTVPGWNSATADDEVSPIELISGSRGYSEIPCRACGEHHPDTWAAVEPYGWLPALSGTVTVNGVTLPVDVSLSDAISALSDLRGAAQIQVEAGRGDWGFLINGMLVSMASSQNFGPLNVNAQIDQTFLEMLGFYRLVNEAEGDLPWTVDLLAGARYYDIDLSGQFNLGGVLVFNRGQSQNWVDLVTGVRTEVAITDSLSVFGNADVGGFGIGTSSDPAWNVYGGARYKVACVEGLSLAGGYRWFDIRETNNTNDPTAFGFNVLMHGPFAAFVYEF
jgi:hypothetical protein